MKQLLSVKNIEIFLFLFYLVSITSCTTTGYYNLDKLPENKTYENIEITDVIVESTKDAVKKETPEILQEQIILNINKNILSDSVSTSLSNNYNTLQIKPKIVDLNNGSQFKRYLFGRLSSSAKAKLGVYCSFVEKKSQKEISRGIFEGYIKGGFFGGSPNQKTMSKFVSDEIVDFLQDYKLIYFVRKSSMFYLGLSYEYWNLDSKINDVFNYNGTIVFDLGWKSINNPFGLELCVLNHNYSKLYYKIDSYSLYGMDEIYTNISAGGVMLNLFYQTKINSFDADIGITNAFMSMVSGSAPDPENYYDDRPENIKNFQDAYYDIMTYGFGISTKISYNYKFNNKFGLSPFLSTRYIFANGKSKMKSRSDISLGGISVSCGLNLYLQKITSHLKD